jgi:glycerophosphoryl diester phosphodiesterase
VNPLLRGAAAPLVVGHRGAAAVAPENTMPAFDAAWAAGATWIEADVQPTADGVPVMLHDDDVDRTTNGRGPVRSIGRDALEQLDAGAWFGPQFAGTRVPLLDQLLGTITAGRSLLLEIKGPHTRRQLETVIETIAARRPAGTVFLESFEVPALELVRQLLPTEPVGLLVERIGDDPVADCRRLGATAYNPHVLDLLDHPDLVAELHESGIAVMVWTADHPELWAALTELGVDAIITNDPGALVTWQAARQG